MERSVDVVFTLAELAAITTTLLPLVRSGAWWIRIFDFPRVQIAVIGVTLLAADLVLRPDAGPGARVVQAALVLCILYQLYKIRPYTLLAREQVDAAKKPRGGSTLGLLLANVKIDNRNSTRLREIIADADPDVILIVEADDWWQKELDGLAEAYPFAVRQAQDNSYGMLLYSRFDFGQSEVRFLVEDDVPSIRAAVTLPAGTVVELHCLHPKPPVPQESDESSQRDAELMVVGKEVRGKGMPVIVFGDLNDVAWSRTTLLFQKISGLLDPRIGRGLYNSFHARYFFLRFPLDHFFHSTHLRLIELKRLAYFGSDHFPMYIRLSYEPQAAHQQTRPEADASDQAEATEIVLEGSTPSRSRLSGIAILGV